MEICSHLHSEICFNEEECPLCKNIENNATIIKGLSKKISKLETKWCRLSDKMPELNITVLCWSLNRGFFTSYFSGDKIDEQIKLSSYWMYLPNIPFQTSNSGIKS